MDSLIQDFWMNKSSRSETLYQILQLLHNTGLEESVRQATLEEYTGYLDITATQQDRAEQQGLQIQGEQERREWQTENVDRREPVSGTCDGNTSWEKPNLSYNEFIETSSIKSGNKGFQSPQTPKMMNSQEERTNPIRKNKSINHSCCGTWLKSPPRPEKLMEAKRLLKRHSPFSRRTSTLPNEKFNRQLQPHVASQNPSGSMCSRERQSTSMSSSVISTTLPLLRIMWATLEEQKSVLEKQIQLERCKWVGTEMSPGMWPLKQLHLHSPTKAMSYDSGETTWPQNSLPSKLAVTTNLLHLTGQLGQWFEVDSQSCSLIETSSPSYTQHSSSLTGSKEAVGDNPHLENCKVQKNAWQRSVDDSTAWEVVTVPQAHVGTNTSVENVDNMDITKRTALSRIDMLYRMHSKYLRYNGMTRRKVFSFQKSHLTLPTGLRLQNLLQYVALAYTYLLLYGGWTTSWYRT